MLVSASALKRFANRSSRDPAFRLPCWKSAVFPATVKVDEASIATGIAFSYAPKPAKRRTIEIREMSADWFCKIGDKKVGPLNNQQLKTFVAKGQLKPEHLVRRGGDGPWVPAGRIKGLFAPGASGGQSQGKTPPASAKPLPRASKSDAAPAAKASPLPTAAESPQPPAEVPQEISLGNKHKHGPQLNVDKFEFETTPVMVSRRKMKTGIQGLKKAEQKKVTIILMSVIGGGLTIGLIIFIVALANGWFSSPKPEERKDLSALSAADTATKPAPEKKPAEQKSAQVRWPTNWKKVSVETTTLGDVNVMVLKPFHGAPPKGVKTSDSEVLFVPVNLWLKEDAKKPVDLTSWADEKLKKAVFLKDDDKEGKGNAFELLGQVPKIGDMKAVTKERIQVYLVFEMPAKIPKTMYVVLPGAAFHADGSIIAYQFDKDDVVREPKTAAGAAGGERVQAVADSAN
jgi:hypothetical protein